MKEILIQSHILTIRKTRAEDMDYVISAERDEENAQYVGQWVREEHLKALDSKELLHLTLEEPDGRRIGYMILAGMESGIRSIELKRIVLAEKGRGYGKETLRLVKELAFGKFKAHRLWLDVRLKNARASYLYRTSGFMEEGILRDACMFNGQYESLAVMSILENEYNKDRDIP